MYVIQVAVMRWADNVMTESDCTLSVCPRQESKRMLSEVSKEACKGVKVSAGKMRITLGSEQRGEVHRGLRAESSQVKERVESAAPR